MNNIMYTTQGLVDWTDGVSPEEIDAILEWLSDNGLLTEHGESFKHDFWLRYLNAGSSQGADP